MSSALSRSEFSALLPKNVEEMLHTDFHMHSNLSDGHDSLRDMVRSAIQKGFRTIGLSDHATTSFDMSYCMNLSDYAPYKEQVRSLATEFSDQIRVLLGMEQDVFADIPAEGFDYLIGSVHFIRVPRTPNDEEREAQAEKAGLCFSEDAVFIPVDNTPAMLKAGADLYFDGDFYQLAEEYFRLVSEVPKRTNANIIGHFDLISKFYEHTPLFDAKNPRYITAWKKAVDKLIPYGLPFEINFGAMSRGHRTTPYPTTEIISYIKAQGGTFLFSSDSHAAENVGYKFEMGKSFLSD